MFCEKIGFGYGYFGHTRFGHGTLFEDFPCIKLVQAQADNKTLLVRFGFPVSIEEGADHSALNIAYYKIYKKENEFETISITKVEHLKRRTDFIFFTDELEGNTEYVLEIIGENGKSIKWIYESGCEIPLGFNYSFISKDIQSGYTPTTPSPGKSHHKKLNPNQKIIMAPEDMLHVIHLYTRRRKQGIYDSFNIQELNSLNTGKTLTKRDKTINISIG